MERPDAGEPLAYDRDVPDPAAEALLAALGWDDPALDRAIPAGDEMLSWAEDHRLGSRQQALVTYFTGGAMAARAVEAALAWRFGPPPGPESAARGAARPRVLDFASGWGRVTRFLVRRRPAADLTVSDIDADAVAFQRRRFGVGGFPSAERPEDLACDERFDAVVALSLFSHLPEAGFRAWLGRLAGLVAPGGLLLLSVHGDSELPPGRSLPPSGIHFEPISETGRLDKASYGSSWVGERFVGEALAGLGRPRLAWRRFPRGLWHLQDLYLVLPDGETDAARLSACALPDEPRGSLDGWARTPAGEVELHGWAATAAGPARRVEAWVGGRRVAETAPGLRRDDVAALLGSEAAGSGGWRLLLPRGEAARSGETLVLVAESADGTRGVLHAATLEAAATHLRARQAQAAAEAALREEIAARDRRVAALGWEAETLRRRIAAMEASRFWKLRDAWWAVRRRLGLAPPE
ncbi:MAG TPA: class I SAM-dependent methyltransferase [Thermoanaerobaculia bacterium]|nr:class I SAM-dependent methyltransferase [Thermoanaerobaculia bacterium]